MNVLRDYDYNNIIVNTCQYLKSIPLDEVVLSSEKNKYDKIVNILCPDKSKHRNFYEHNTFELLLDNSPPELSEEQKIEQKQNQIDLFMSYIIEEAHKLKEYKFQLNATFSDIVSSDFCKNRTGFTGTPYFIGPYDRNIDSKLEINPIMSEEAEGNIIYSIVNSKVNIIDFNSKTTKNNLDKIINYLKTDMSHNQTKYNVLIDVGSYLLGYKNLDVVKRICNEFDKFDKCIYIDILTDKKMVYIKENEDIIEYNPDDNKIKIMFISK